MRDDPEAQGIDATSVLAHHPAVATAEIDGEGILYDERTQAVHTLNGPALAVWSHLDGERPLGAVATDLATRYAADPDQISADVLHAARDLTARGLLARAGASLEEVVGIAGTGEPLALDPPPG